MKKRFLGVLLTLVLVIGMLPTMVSASSNNAIYGSSLDSVTTEGNLSEIISTQEGTIYIKLKDNVTVSENIAINAKDVYLDLSGFTVTISKDNVSFVVQNGASLTISDTSSEKTGMVSSEYIGAIFSVRQNSSATFNSGYYKTAKGNIISALSGSTVDINGGTYEGVNSAAYAFVMSGNDSNLNINSGNFKAASADRPNIQYRAGNLSLTNFEAVYGHIGVMYMPELTESVAISSFVTLKSDDYMIADSNGVEITQVPGQYKVFYIALAHDIKYDLNGGTSSELSDHKFPVPGTYAIPTFDMVTPPAGKVLSYWEVNGVRYEEGGSIYISTIGTTTLKAFWQDQVQYNVNLHSNNGESKKISSTEWSAYTLPDSIPEDWTVGEGYCFAGWALTTTGTAMTGQVKLKGDTDFYAIYKRITYPITYVAEGARYVPGSHNKTYGVTATLSGTIPVKEGYDFVEWLDTETGNTYAPKDTYEENRALTLSAVWKLKTYEVSFVAEGATNVPENVIKTHGITLKISEQKPKKEGYIFHGWALEEDGAVVYKAGADYTENSINTLYAVWVPAEFTVMEFDAVGKTAMVVLAEEGTYIVVFADYEDNKLANFEYVPVTVSEADAIGASITKDFTLGTDDKIMLWKGMRNPAPLCGTYIVE